MSEHETEAAENVVPFPETPEVKERKSARDRASIDEEVRRTQAFQIASEALARRGLMSASDRFTLARNLRDFVYRLQAEGRLKVKDLAAEVRGPHTPREVRASNEYLAPIGVDTEEECRLKHPNRRLAGKPSAFKEMALAAARIAGVDEREAILELVQGSPFWPDAPAVTEDRRQAAIHVASILALLRRPLDSIHPVERYFDEVEEQEIVPVEDDSQVRLLHYEIAGGLDHMRIPSVPVAQSSLGRREALLVIANDDEEEDDFEASIDAGKAIGFQIERIRHFALGVARLRSGIRPVGVFTHRLCLTKTRLGPVIESRTIDDMLSGWMPDDFLSGWWRLSISSKDRPIEAAWRFADGEDVVAVEKSSHPEPDVYIKPLDAEFLMVPEPGMWRLESSQREPFQWRGVADRNFSRLGNDTSLAGIIERVLHANGEDGTLVIDLGAAYRRKVDALAAWRRRTFGEIERSIERVRAELLATELVDRSVVPDA